MYPPVIVRTSRGRNNKGATNAPTLKQEAPQSSNFKFTLLLEGKRRVKTDRRDGTRKAAALV